MENPDTWGLAEQAISQAIIEHEGARKVSVVGLSLVGCIAAKLRAEGIIDPDRERLLLEQDGDIQHCAGCQGQGEREGTVGWCHGLQKTDFE